MVNHGGSTPIIRAPGAFPDGTVALPGAFFALDTDSGFYRIGSDNVGLSLGGVKAWDYAATVTSFTGANTTNNTTLTIENTTNTAVAAHAIVEAKVGGNTSVGDPQFRWSVPSGTPAGWYAAIDNSDGDSLHIGTGTTVGSSNLIRLDGRVTGIGGQIQFGIKPLALTMNDSASAELKALDIAAQTATLSGTTTVTALFEYAALNGLTIAQSGGAVTVNKATGFSFIAPIPGTSVTLTEGSAIRILNAAAPGGTYTRQAGIIIEALTRGTTNPQILLYNGSTVPTSAVADTVSICAEDLSAATVFSLTAETAVVSTADFVMTTKIIIRYNGTSYALGASTTLT